MGVTDNFYLLLGFRVSPGELVVDCSLRVELPSGTSQQVTTTIHYLCALGGEGDIILLISKLIIPLILLQITVMCMTSSEVDMKC